MYGDNHVQQRTDLRIDVNLSGLYHLHGDDHLYDQSDMFGWINLSRVCHLHRFIDV